MKGIYAILWFYCIVEIALAKKKTRCIGKCPEIDPLDTSIYLPSTDCRKFCECSNGVAVIFKCPDGLEFNSDLDVCDWPEYAGCSGGGGGWGPPGPPPTWPPWPPRPPPTRPSHPRPPNNSNCIGTCPSTDPLDESVYLRSKNCNEFCECSNGVAVLFECPEGLEFNSQLNVCDWPEDAGCSGNGGSPGRPTRPPWQTRPPWYTRPPPTRTPRPPNNSNCIGTCPSTDPLDTSVYLPSKNCDEFCECSNGEAIVLPCPEGLEFNPQLNVCDWPEEAGCSGNGGSPGGPTRPPRPPWHTRPPWQTRPPRPPPTRTPPPPNNSNCIGTCPSTDPLDTSIYLPSKNCNEFCECSNGVAIVLPCPDGLEFNPVLNVCDWPANAGCSGGGGRPPTGRPTHRPPWTRPTKPPGNNSTRPTGKPPGSRPTRPPNNSNCIGTCPSTDPLDTSVYLPSKNCNEFCECSNGVAIVLPCPDGLEFNQVLNVCDWPANAGCSGGGGRPPTGRPTHRPPWTKPPENNSTRPTGKPPGSRPTRPPPPNNGNCIGTCPSTDPLDTSVYLPSRNCNEFCECSNGVAIVLPCPDGLEFNPVLNVCDWPANAGCSGGGGRPPTGRPTHRPPWTRPTKPPGNNSTRPTGKPPGSRPTRPPNNSNCIGTCPSTDPLDTSVYLPSRNCNEFCECSNGVAIVLPCPDGLEFNPVLNVCDWPANAGCSGGGGRPPTGRPTHRPPWTRPTKPPGNNSTRPTGKPPGSRPTRPPNNGNCIGTCPSTDPLDTSVYLPSRNCNEFCECSNGVAIVLPCPDGLEFNPVLNVCDWPANAGCSGSGGRPPTGRPTHRPPWTRPTKPPGNNSTRPTGKPPGSRPTRPPNNSNCIGTCPSTDPLDTSVYLPSRNCNEFCECSNGVAIVLPCPDGLEFNPVLNVCDWPANAGCSGGGGRPPTGRPTHRPPWTKPPENNSTRPTGKPPGSRPTRPPPPNNGNCIGTCPSTDPLDTSVYLPSRNCNEFCECSNGVAIVLPCPDGLEFNPVLNVCDWPANAGCSGGGGRPPTGRPTHRPPWTRPTKPPGNNSTRPTGKPPGSRPTRPPNNSNCIGTCPSTDPLDTSVYLPSKNCNEFCECSNGVAIVLPCPDGLEFNQVLNVCDWPANAGCSGGGGRPPTGRPTHRPPWTRPTKPPGNNSTRPTGKPPGSRPTRPPPPNNGNCIGTCPSTDPLDTSVYLPSKNCNEFCECSNGEAILLPCPDGLEFNPVLNVCDWPENAGCSGGGGRPSRPTGRPPWTKPTRPPPPNNRNCIGKCPSIDPLDTSVYLPSKNCNEFCECSNGVPILLPCPEGLEFNPTLDVCDWPANAGCTGGAVRPPKPPRPPPTPPPVSGCARIVQKPRRGIWWPIECSTESSPVGKQCTLKCNNGYEPYGHLTISCGNSGWNDSLPQCKTIDELGNDFVKDVNKTIIGRDVSFLFLLDESGSVSLKNFELEKTFTDSLVGAFPLSRHRSAGVVSFSSDADIDVPANMNDSCTFIGQVEKIKYFGGGTDIAQALSVAQKAIADVSYLNRVVIIFLLTDGVSNTNPLLIADKIKKDGHLIWTLGIGGYDRAELEGVASKDENGNPLFFGIKDFEVFESLIKYLHSNNSIRSKFSC